MKRVMQAINKYDSENGTIETGQVIIVKTGDYRQLWQEAVIKNLYITDHVDEEGNEFYHVDASVEFINEPFQQYLSDVDGDSKDWFKLKEVS